MPNHENPFDPETTDRLLVGGTGLIIDYGAAKEILFEHQPLLGSVTAILGTAALYSAIRPNRASTFVMRALHDFYRKSDES